MAVHDCLLIYSQLPSTVGGHLFHLHLMMHHAMITTDPSKMYEVCVKGFQAKDLPTILVLIPTSLYIISLSCTAYQSVQKEHQVSPKCFTFLQSIWQHIPEDVSQEPQISQVQTCLQLCYKISFACLKTATRCKTSKLYSYGTRSQSLPRSYQSPGIMRVELMQFPNMEILSSVTK
jgi:hypothetical protein